MSTTICRGCGQLVPAGQDVCGNCGVRALLAGNGSPGPVAVATETVPLVQATAPVAAAAPVVDWTPDVAAMERARKAQRRRMALFAVMALIASVGLRAALGGVHHKTPPQQGDLVAQMPVDAKGASESFGNGGKITVPKGAVDKPQTINIYRQTLNRRITALSPNGGTPIIVPPGTLVVYSFGPTTLVFLQPVTIVLPIPPGQNGLVFVTNNGQIRFLPGIGRGNTVSLVVTSFNFNNPGAIRIA